MSRPRPTVLQALKRHLPARSSLILAVSGGQDSVVLLHAAASLAPALQLELAVAHIDHNLRPQSAADAEFVSDLARRCGLPFFLKRADNVPAGANLEDWGRKLRYRFFKELLSRGEYRYVVTAHTADDVAETFLMRVVANKELNSIARRDESRQLIRPLLDVPREAISAYGAEHALAFVEDQTNSDVRFLRNRVRHRLIPLLKEHFDPRIIEVLSNRAAAAAADIACLNELADNALTSLADLDFGDKIWLRAVRAQLAVMPHGLKWRFAERLFRKKLGFNLGRTKALELVRFLEGYRVGLELPGGLRLRARAGGVCIVESFARREGR